MNRIILSFLACAFILKNTHAQVSGCTDSQANNYNASATINDGSCTYATTNLTLTEKTLLSAPLLNESSGVEFLGLHLWTHNDSGNSNSLYRIDTTSSTVFQTVLVSNATNVDWEDVTSNNDYLFVGDFGNNNGNRQNLKIYRIDRAALTPAATSVTADIINFSYSDQTTFPSLPNNNNFDCESMIFWNDSIHLLSKNWVDKQCKHYVLPNVIGTHVAQLRETFNSACLITGGTIQQNGVIALVGYDLTGLAPIYLWMLYDYKDGLFFNGNKRRFNLATALNHGQVEAVDFRENAYGYISNERFSQIVTVDAKLKSFDLANYLPPSFVFPKPDAAFTVNDNIICRNTTVNFSDLSINGATSWQWIFPGGTPSSSTIQNPAVKYTSAGVHNVTLIVGNATGYDTLVQTSYITVNTLPTAVVTSGGPTHFCTGGSVLLSANTGIGLSYQWRKNNVAQSGAINPDYTATTTANYKVIVTNQSGCTKASNTIAVTGPPKTGITVTGSLDLCPGDSVKLEAIVASGNTYQWKKNNLNISGATDYFYFATTAGDYKVKITDVWGCSKTTGIKTVTENCRIGVEDVTTQFIFSPNPSSESFVVHTSTQESFNLIITDYSGRVVEEYYGLRQNEVEFGENLPSGIYFVLYSANGIIQTVKAIKTD